MSMHTSSVDESLREQRVVVEVLQKRLVAAQEQHESAMRALAAAGSGGERDLQRANVAAADANLRQAEQDLATENALLANLRYEKRRIESAAAIAELRADVDGLIAELAVRQQLAVAIDEAADVLVGLMKRFFIEGEDLRVRAVRLARQATADERISEANSALALVSQEASPAASPFLTASTALLFDLFSDMSAPHLVFEPPPGYWHARDGRRLRFGQAAQQTAQQLEGSLLRLVGRQTQGANA